MKWILLSAMTVVLPAFSMAKAAATTVEPPTQPVYTNCEEECDPDLFRKDVQLYSGHVEFLYWSLTEGDLDYAQKMRHAAWGPSPSFAQGRYENASYNFDPGFRIGLSYFRAPHFWEVKWQYTRMTNRGKSSVEKPVAAEKFLTGTWPQISTEPLTRATSHIHFNYNVFDMVVDRVFFPNPHLRLRVIGGGTVAWMNQDWKVRYFDATSNTTTIRNRWNYAGGGLKIASMFDWYWTWDLYMTALTSFGVLMGGYSNHAKQTTTVQTTPADNTAIPIRDTCYHDIRPAFTAQMMLGPSWQKNFSCSRMEVFAGFEMNTWFNLQEIYRSSSGAPSAAKETWINSSLLSLYGITTRITYDF